MHRRNGLNWARNGLHLFLFAAVMPLWIGVTPRIHAQVNLPGSIAMVGSDNNIYTMMLSDGRTTALTDDADERRRYQWPTWSQGGELAYFCCDAATTRSAETETFVSSDGIVPGERVAITQGALFTYAAWAPASCDAGEVTCRDLAVLLSPLGESRFAVDLIRVRSDVEAESMRVGRGAPFYFSWSPDGQRMLWQRNTRSVDVYSLEEQLITGVDIPVGVFPAPTWSPVDDRLLVGVAGDGGTDLALVVNGEVSVLQDSLIGEVAFNWSPDGNAVAYRTLTRDGVSGMRVIDAVSGEVLADSGNDRVLSFFWSPDSQLIAYVSAAAPPGSFNIAFVPDTLGGTRVQEDGLRWSVLDVMTGDIRSYGSFIPTEDMLYLLAYFNQFAQSHRLWSPDSSHIVFGERTPNGDDIVSILDVTRRDTVPSYLADGHIGIWSYR